MPLNQTGVLSSFQRFIPISAFYPHFSVLSPFQFPPFSFSVLSRPSLYLGYYKHLRVILDDILIQLYFSPTTYASLVMATVL